MRPFFSFFLSFFLHSDDWLIVEIPEYAHAIVNPKTAILVWVSFVRPLVDECSPHGSTRLSRQKTPLCFAVCGVNQMRQVHSGRCARFWNCSYRRLNASGEGRWFPAQPSVFPTRFPYSSAIPGCSSTRRLFDSIPNKSKSNRVWISALKSRPFSDDCCLRCDTGRCARPPTPPLLCTPSPSSGPYTAAAKHP
jgi:hypothetical protein